MWHISASVFYRYVGYTTAALIADLSLCSHNSCHCCLLSRRRTMERSLLHATGCSQGKTKWRVDTKDRSQCGRGRFLLIYAVSTTSHVRSNTREVVARTHPFCIVLADSMGYRPWNARGPVDKNLRRHRSKRDPIHCYHCQ